VPGSIATEQRDWHQHRCSSDDRRKSERDPDDQLEDPDGARRSNAEQVGNAKQPNELSPGRPPAERVDDAHTHREEQQVEPDETRDRVHAHFKRPIEIPSSSCHRTSYGPPSFETSHP
jgi:hypothetical protein